MISERYKNLVIVMNGRPWVPVPADNSADDYRLGQMMHRVLTAGEVFCRLGMRRDVAERTPVVLLPLPGCPHDNLSLPTTSDPTSVCADCGADVPPSVRVSIFVMPERAGFFEHAFDNDSEYWGMCEVWTVYNPKLSFLGNQ